MKLGSKDPGNKFLYTHVWWGSSEQTYITNKFVFFQFFFFIPFDKTFQLLRKWGLYLKKWAPIILGAHPLFILKVTRLMSDLPSLLPKSFKRPYSHCMEEATWIKMAQLITLVTEIRSSIPIFRFHLCFNDFICLIVILCSCKSLWIDLCTNCALQINLPCVYIHNYNIYSSCSMSKDAHTEFHAAVCSYIWSKFSCHKPEAILHQCQQEQLKQQKQYVLLFPLVSTFTIQLDGWFFSS